MKKLLSIGLAAMLAFGLATTSFAEEAGNAGATTPADSETTVTLTDASTATIKKYYKATNANTISPEETFNFSITAKSVKDAAEGITDKNMPVPTISSVTYKSGEAATGDGLEKDVTINLNKPDTNPAESIYTSVGVYTYTITETDNKTAGVDYYTDEIDLVVTVVNDTNDTTGSGKVRVATVHVEKPYETDKENKVDSITNTYSAGTLTVTKNVAGTLGDKSKKFDIVVTLTSAKEVKSTITYDNTNIAPTAWQKQEDGTWTTSVTVNLADKESSEFTNIPYGVDYTVSETKPAGYEEPQYAYSDVNKATDHKMDTAAETATVTNTKNGDIDTGVVLNNMPYILVLAVLAAGVAVFIIRKRRED